MGGHGSSFQEVRSGDRMEPVLNAWVQRQIVSVAYVYSFVVYSTVSTLSPSLFVTEQSFMF